MLQLDFAHPNLETTGCPEYVIEDRPDEWIVRQSFPIWEYDEPVTSTSKPRLSLDPKQGSAFGASPLEVLRRIAFDYQSHDPVVKHGPPVRWGTNLRALANHVAKASPSCIPDVRQITDQTFDKLRHNAQWSSLTSVQRTDIIAGLEYQQKEFHRDLAQLPAPPANPASVEVDF